MSVYKLLACVLVPLHVCMSVYLFAEGDDCKSCWSAKENIQNLEKNKKTFPPKWYTHTCTKLSEPGMQSEGGNCRQHLIGLGKRTDVRIETQRWRKTPKDERERH